jgi:hypothetical protein
MLGAKHGRCGLEDLSEFLDRIAAVLAAEESLVRDVERNVHATQKLPGAQRAFEFVRNEL